jgi:recombination associated protein RdgC
MFKNLIIYRFQNAPEEIETMESGLVRFTPCGATQEKSMGWIEPREHENGPLVESVDGQRILRFQIETKAVPGAVVRKKAQEAADHIEASTGRKPGKKETRALREDALLALLPQAFPKQKAIWVWFDMGAGLLFIGAASQSAADDVVTALVTSFDGLQVAMLNTAVTPSQAMTQWLLTEDENDWPEGLAVERQVVLKSHSEDKAVVKFDRHHLINDEIRKHIAEGKLPEQLALSWEGRVSFVMTAGMALRKLSFLEGALEDRQERDDAFDADVALATGELRQMIPALIAAMGGELKA